MSELSLEEVRHALSTARRLGLPEVKLTKGDETFKARLSSDWDEEEEDYSAAEALPAGPVRKAVNAPVVGYFKPGPAWQQDGAVESGKSLGEVTALGLSNEIKSPLTGKLVELAVNAGDPVEFGQTLAWVEE
jgi:biotin carboxyl carrier protein